MMFSASSMLCGSTGMPGTRWSSIASFQPDLGLSTACPMSPAWTSPAGARAGSLAAHAQSAVVHYGHDCLTHVAPAQQHTLHWIAWQGSDCIPESPCSASDWRRKSADLLRFLSASALRCKRGSPVKVSQQTAFAAFAQYCNRHAFHTLQRIKGL